MDMDTNPTASAEEVIQALQGLAEGRTIADMTGRDYGDLEAMYQTGCELYEGGRYADAVAIFIFLAVNNHLDDRYHFACAAAMQMNRQWAEALRMYGLAASFDYANPVPSFHIAECLLALGMKPEARVALETVLAQSEGEAAHAALAERAKALMALICTTPSPETKEP